MIIIFIGGHGRCDENLLCNVPEKVALTWYGCQGNSVGKDFSSAILKGAFTSPLPTGVVTTPLCEHYSCDSISLECEMRAQAFLEGPWDTDTYLIQARPDCIVPLSAILAYAVDKWKGRLIEIRWAVCRTSVRRKSFVVHRFNKETNMPYNELRSEKDPAPVPCEGTSSGIPIEEFEKKIYLEQWSSEKKTVSINETPTMKQMQNIFGGSASKQTGSSKESPL
ncbi:hypothetical protein GAY29_29260 [Azospirillum brasilense]|uniref:hypothetical protein n=1 Tax=Azospirillum brasilense TaxID=192 RepID=UPI00190B87C7|nr:hypothetical protein [Azospirillum brasilense]MBK3737085.1 hypothetical protein [Azospirillum brasilense]